MLLSISMKNWRSHESTNLEFRKGTNLLIGIMGSGKSSVLDAICFALFGTFPAIERRKQSISDILRLNESRASVELKFLSDGKTYTVVRKIEKRKESAATDAEIFRDEALVEKGATSVNKYIEHILHVDYDLFTRAIYSEQNNIDYFLTLDPRKRKLEMDTLLGLDKFEDARSNCTSLANRVKASRKSLESKFSRQALEEAQKREKELEEKQKSLAESENAIFASLASLKARIAALESEFLRLKQAREAHQKLEKEKIRLEAIVSSLKKELDGKSVSESELNALNESRNVLEKERMKISSEQKAADAELSRLTLALGTLNAKEKSLEKDRAEQEATKKRIESMLGGRSREHLNSELKRQSELLSSMDAEQRSLISRLSELEDSSKKLKPGTAKCPICNNPLDSHSLEQIVKERGEEASKANARIAEIKAQSSALKPAIQQLQDSIRMIDISLSKSEDLGKRIELNSVKESEKSELKQKLDLLAAKKKDSTEKQDSLSSQLQSIALSIREKEQLLRKKLELNLSETSLVSAKEKLFAIHFEEQAYEQKQKEFESARMDNERFISQKQRIELEIKSASEMRQLLSKEIERFIGMEKDISSQLKLEEELTIYRNALLQTQLSLRSDLVESINAAMREIWAIFYPYGDYKEIKLSATEKDYVFELYDNDWKALESVASGGERACAALTLRVALAMVLTPNLSWLILDEPTHNLDREAVELLSETLQAKVPEVVEQTFVITHEEGLMGSEFASSYRFTRDKSKFEGTKAEKI